ncbi:MAG: HEAT repeat domain-containing protein [Candidatus Accumulibacter sp.]|jgi:hypothetical protein|nr:HEAT repeat domain-containing protein [Accumulibacter sp.]
MKRQDWTTENLFSRLINNRSGKNRWEKIRILQGRPSHDVYAKCIELAHSENTKERIIGIDVLAQLGAAAGVKRKPYEKQALRLYFDLLDRETDTGAVYSILCAIGHNSRHGLTLAQIKKLAKYQTHKSSTVRNALVFSLSCVDKKAAIDVLIALSSDRSNHVRDWATFSLGQQIETDNEEIRAALWKRVNDPHRDTRCEAIYGLAKRKDARAVELIRRELLSDNGNGEYGVLIFDAIREFRETSFLPLLEQNLAVARKDERTNPWWLEHLEECIDFIRNGAAK